MRTWGHRLAALLLTVGLASTAVAADEYRDAACAIGDFLLDSARHDGESIYWPQFVGGPPSTTDDQRPCPLSLYSGVTGVGFTLLNLHRVTGEARWLAAARGVGLHLVQRAQPLPGGGVRWEGTSERKDQLIPEGDRVGLYDGNAGIGLFLMHLAEATKEDRFRALGKAAFERVLHEAEAEAGGCHWLYSFQDVIGGEAGIGVALLEMHRLTRDARYLDAARKAARWLLTRATRTGDAMQWTTYDVADASFSHGVSGIGFFLLALPDAETRKAGVAAARWVQSVSVPAGKDGRIWQYYAGEPPAEKQNWVMNSWCHGAPGNVRLFLLQHRLTADPRALATALAGGVGIGSECRLDAGAPSYANATYCCGAAGCLVAFLDLYRASRDARLLTPARALADSIVTGLRREAKFRAHAAYDTEDEAEKKYPYYETGFMQGNAGIAYVLLRLSEELAGRTDRLILLPDEPFAIP